MSKIKLLFLNEKDLRRFQAILTCDYMEIDARALTILCNCSHEDIDLAVQAFRATVVGDKSTAVNGGFQL